MIPPWLNFWSPCFLFVMAPRRSARVSSITQRAPVERNVVTQNERRNNRARKDGVVKSTAKQPGKGTKARLVPEPTDPKSRVPETPSTPRRKRTVAKAEDPAVRLTPPPLAGNQLDTNKSLDGPIAPSLNRPVDPHRTNATLVT